MTQRITERYQVFSVQLCVISLCLCGEVFRYVPMYVSSKVPESYCHPQRLVEGIDLATFRKRSE